MERHLTTSKTFRYELSGNLISPANVLFVLHGYGQLARFFIRKFEGLSDALIVAPEGMHRFYLNGTDGRVGASWMTKEDRLTDIQDNIFWLDRLATEILREFPSLVNFNLLGFSQGGATAVRWANFGKTSFESLCLWACVFPPDLTLDEERFGGKKFFLLGFDDQFYTTDDQVELVQFYENAGYQTIRFQGTHDIESDALKNYWKHRG